PSDTETGWDLGEGGNDPLRDGSMSRTVLPRELACPDKYHADIPFRHPLYA
ncbi:MAG: hypothetical protein QOH31_1149, partial [Verrucomicrobiota bacterium]